MSDAKSDAKERFNAYCGHVDVLQAKVKKLEETVAAVEATLAAVQAQKATAAAPRTSKGPVPGSDEDLESKYGDPKVFKNPRAWDGPTYEGEPFSTCPPDYLDMQAEMLDAWADRKEPGSKEEWRQRADAARARAWAKRIRDGHVRQERADDMFAAPPKAAPKYEPDTDDIPF